MADLDLDALRRHLPDAGPSDLEDYARQLCTEVERLRKEAQALSASLESSEAQAARFARELTARRDAGMGFW